MKTPNEIKKGLQCINCDICPYKKQNCVDVLNDALAYIKQLESIISRVSKIVNKDGDPQ